MSDDLVDRLRAFAADCRGSKWQSREKTILLCDSAADEIAALQARVAELEAKLAKAVSTLEYIADTLALYSAKECLAELTGWDD